MSGPCVSWRSWRETAPEFGPCRAQLDPYLAGVSTTEGTEAAEPKPDGLARLQIEYCRLGQSPRTSVLAHGQALRSLRLCEKLFRNLESWKTALGWFWEGRALLDSHLEKVRHFSFLLFSPFLFPIS